MSSDLDHKLRRALWEHPHRFNNRYTPEARNAFLEVLFRSLTNDRPDYLETLFPNGFPSSYRLQDVRGAQENAEYTEAAKGHPCGHIFKQGEASYHCMTCTDDPTAVLCARCFVSSDHEGHQFHISTSAGNSGCCDCGDEEAWKRPVHCAIHTSTDDFMTTEADVSALPQDLQASIRTTISRALDYFCDVISCSPENLRTPKTIDSVQQDEVCSRLKSQYYGATDEIEINPEFCLVLWNDEKHTVREVRDQVARACSATENFGKTTAEKANDDGRCIVRHSRDLKALLRTAKIIEEIKITVTIRSSRDTFREQMCETIIDWLSDIAGCSIGTDSHIIRRTVCEEILQLWHIGSQAWNMKVGRNDIDDHELEENQEFRQRTMRIFSDPTQLVIERAVLAAENEDDDDPEEEDADDFDVEGEILGVESGDDLDNEEYEILDDSNTESHIVIDHVGDPDATDDADEMDTDGDNDFLDANERMDTEQAVPPPPPPPIARVDDEPVIATGTEPVSRDASESALEDRNRNYQNIPRTPATRSKTHSSSPNHWTVSPIPRSSPQQDLPLYEDLRKNIRIDSMILFDLRLWKQVRIAMRDLLITTVINIPQFKRILGLRFAGVYTTLAQLYLIADREPDHSIINLSLQLLTTPSITEEVVDKGNFLTVLMAILYTFLTTRQVGFPHDVDTDAVLGFDAGSVANRRLYHFFSDLRYFLASPFVQARIRSEKQYLFQYLDMAKLSQGICPNTRAVGEHVEYETDAWISASLLTREINKLCRQFAEAYQLLPDGTGSTETLTCQAIEFTAGAALVNSIGLEHKRFEQSEIKGVVVFHPVGPFPCGQGQMKLVSFAVEQDTLSFHHPLHYTLSWLLEGGKDSALALKSLQNAAKQVVDQLQEKNIKVGTSWLSGIYKDAEDALLALFDYPLRVCAWLAQMKANLWVRNGMSLRHQMNQYKSVTYRDVGHHRDLFLLQTALVACNPARVLASMVDRFGLTNWLYGKYSCVSDCEEGQMLDIAEEFVYLIVNLLSDRDSLMSRRDEPESQLTTLRKDIAHTLCFKALSFSDLCARLTERAQDHGKLQEVLESMTNYRPPEGLHDTGLFELKDQFLQELDPYNSHFTKNQRDEAENIYKTWKAKKLNKSPEDIVLEPKLHPIRSDMYSGLCAVINEPLFANVLHTLLTYVASAKDVAPTISATRIEAFLHVLLHLALVAALEDESNEDVMQSSQPSFTKNALSLCIKYHGADGTTIVQILHRIWSMEEYSSCRSKIRYLLRGFNQKFPLAFAASTKNLHFPSGRFDTDSPAQSESEVEAKKKQAMERKARIMAQMQQQQKSFMDKQGVVDWGDDLSDAETEMPSSTEKRMWKFPADVCIQCREETNDTRLYGTFAMVSDAHLLRQTPVGDADYVREACLGASDLDQRIETERPFGVAGNNYETVKRLTADGSETTISRRGLSRGWPKGWTSKGPVSTSCGHIMHYTCFENYYQSVARRHTHQIARNHPERIALKEFVCPLCKALANVFLPIVWKGTEQSYPGPLASKTSFDIFMDYALPQALDYNPLLQSTDEQLEKTLHAETVLSFNTSAMLPVVNLLANKALALGDLNVKPSSADKPELAGFSELAQAYHRLRESLAIAEKSQIPSGPEHQEYPSNYFSILLDTLANSVAAVEIAYRGRPSDYGTSLLSSIPASTLSHLQVLSSTINAFSASSAIALGSAFGEQYRHCISGLVKAMFGTESRWQREEPAYRPSLPLLETDAFTTFAQSAVTICRFEQFPVHHILRICLTAELVRVAIGLLWYPGSSLVWDTDQSQDGPDISTDEANGVSQLLMFIESKSQVNGISVEPNRFPPATIRMVALALRHYSRAFLRKAALFVHVALGVDFPTTTGSEAALPELDRLRHLLQLPNLGVILEEFSQFSARYTLHKLVGSWIKDIVESQTREDGVTVSNLKPIRVLHPAPLELIGLPEYFDVLIEESHRRRCPTTGKELTDPALCLFCGEIFCAQAVCCMSDWKRGGCNVHLEKCSFPIGMFLFIRKCHVVLLHVVKDPKKVEQNHRRRERGEPEISMGSMAISHGSFFAAPYLTKHGETDSGLRSKHQLILNQKRYDKLLRDTWLMVNGSVWSTVARKLEGEVNAGGWETL